MKNILLLFDLSSNYNRLLLKGIIRYSKEVEQWKFYRISLYYYQLYGEQTFIGLVKRWHIDAVIGQLSETAARELQQMGIPVVAQNYSSRALDISNITGDYWNTGVMAAKFFLKRHYRNFAYCGSRSTVWSREREDGYTAHLKLSGFEVHSLNLPVIVNGNVGLEDFNKGKAWLESLPKPIALFACDDACALEVADICRLLGLRVPEDIAILGVDGDEILCNMTSPSLSSIVLDVENGGYRAAALLHSMMQGKQDHQRVNIVINPVKIVARQSTERYVISDPMVKDIVDRMNDPKGIRMSLKELLSYIPLSRRVCEKRFKAAMGTTLYQYMLELRISRLAESLISTDRPVTDLMMDFGFEDYANLTRVFKCYYKMTPMQWRKFRTGFSEKQKNYDRRNGESDQ